MEGMKKEMAHVKDMKRKLEHRGSVGRGGRFRMEGNSKRKDGSQEMLSEHRITVNEGCCHEADKN